MSFDCPAPFVTLNNYPKTGGNIRARVCSTLPLEGEPTCCLPCPQQNYFYPDDFGTLVRASSYVNLAGVICCCFLLLSFFVLPVEYTHRHYLSVCLVFSILLMEVSFVIPLGSDNTQCYNEITPNDMYSSASCAVSGALVLGGGWCVGMWIFLRTLSLHLQICWQMSPGPRFFTCAQIAGWSIPIIFLAVSLSITGVSFRFGNSCHINSEHGLATYWGPLLAIAAASIVTQSITFGYCIQVYLRSLFEEKQTTAATSRSPLPYSNSISTVTYGQAFRRIQRVFALQWKGILVVILILADTVFFATVFLRFDGITEKTEQNSEVQLEWLMCMIKNDGNKNLCLDVAKKLVLSEATALSVLFLLSCNGLWAMLLLGPRSIFPGWLHFAKNVVHKKKPAEEFVSFSARRVSEPDPAYEMLSGPNKRDIITSTTEPDPSIVKLPEPSMTVSVPKEYAPRVYDPSNFSVHSNTYSPPYSTTYSPYRDLDSMSRSPGLASPYSQNGTYSPNRSRSIISQQREKSRTNSNASIPLSPYRNHRREFSRASTMEDVSPTYPPDHGPDIGVAR